MSANDCVGLCRLVHLCVCLRMVVWSFHLLVCVCVWLCMNVYDCVWFCACAYDFVCLRMLVFVCACLCMFCLFACGCV